MKAPRTAHRIEAHDITNDNVKVRKAVGYIRVSTELQAMDGLSLDEQTAAIGGGWLASGLLGVRRL